MLDNIAFGIVTGILFVFLIVIFCVLLIKLYIRKIKNYTALLYQQDIDHQRSLNSAILETQEQLLRNIAQDLHDDAGQQLTYINFQLENLKLDSNQMTTLLQPVSASVRQLSDTIRGISHALNNQSLNRQDIVKALTLEIERLQKNPRVVFSFEVIGKPSKNLSIDEKVVIFRIFQEAVNNIFKHASATAVDVVLTFDPDLTLQITDNGKGFDRSLPHDEATLGMASMVSRAGIIGYGLDVKSEPGKGTTILLTNHQSA